MQKCVLDVLDTLAKDHALVGFYDTTFGMGPVCPTCFLHRSTFAAVFVIIWLCGGQTFAAERVRQAANTSNAKQEFIACSGSDRS